MSRPMRRAVGFLAGSSFRRGLLAGLLVMVAARAVINTTVVADWLVAPLLVDDSRGAADAIVVLGAGVIGDCVPNSHGVRRVLLATRLWRQQPQALVVMTGGTGGTCPVAEAMARLAVEVGVTRDRVRVEAASVNTRENAVMSAALMRAWGVSQVLLVTDRLHMRRAAGAFAAVGIRGHRASVPIYEGHEDNISMLLAGLREYAALAYYRWRGWLAEPGLPRPLTGGAVRSTPIASAGTGPIVLLGASYAASWPLTALADMPVVNKGIAGQQSFEMLARFDADVVALSPRAVILWGFINDIFRSGDDIEATVAGIKSAFIAMIARARAQGIVPILATEVTARPPSRSMMDRLAGVAGSVLGKQSYQDRINRHVVAVNDWIVETGDREGILVLQLQQVIAEPGGRRHPAFAQPDGSHITAAGYERLTSYARPVLQEYLGVR